ncbi:PadR family transcriptional regulator [Ruania alkalisoli]|uniref:PadR family transcriptional regulator n=1 Tax=Ruania alkalisoli TaxID=2779775 RepID=A0A7M1SNZ4_9MICO|nr:PadR family transcriptional regulator [Ruania alkalisoli]QOR69296.1 PadR family transcriptional regulator [Ruania alkalisoli]
MSVKQGLLALLSVEPMGVAQLRKEFEGRTGGTWPLNIGQVYTTLQRLERDGLVERTDDADGDGAIERFVLSAAGRDAAEGWWLTPVRRGTPERDELVIKVALAVTTPGVRVRDVVQRQRTETMRSLRDLTRLKADATTDGRVDELAWSLVLDNHIFAAEAELRWLDHIEARAERASAFQTSVSPTAGTAGTAGSAGSMSGRGSARSAASPSPTLGERSTR